MFRLLTLAATLAVLPACFLSVKVQDDSDRGGGGGGGGAVVDTDIREEPATDTAPPEPEPLLVEISADPAELQAGTAGLIVLQISGDLAAADLTALVFDAPLETAAWRALGDGSIVVDLVAPADALGSYGVTVSGEAGEAHVDGVITVTEAPMEHPPTDTDCPSAP